jgi:hypothetical protein
MITSIFTISGVLTVLLSLRHWFLRGTTDSTTGTATTPATSQWLGEPRNRSLISVPRPLRVVRVLEPNQAPDKVGRMVISGRMADVCAELDRLAALH